MSISSIVPKRWYYVTEVHNVSGTMTIVVTYFSNFQIHRSLDARIIIASLQLVTGTANNIGVAICIKCHYHTGERSNDRKEWE